MQVTMSASPTIEPRTFAFYSSWVLSPELVVFGVCKIKRLHRNCIASGNFSYARTCHGLWQPKDYRLDLG